MCSNLGGGGGGSFGGVSVKDFPKGIELITLENLPKITGTSEAQIQYGEDMRRNALNEILSPYLVSGATRSKDFSYKEEYRNAAKSRREQFSEAKEWAESSFNRTPEKDAQKMQKRIKNNTKAAEKYGNTADFIKSSPTSAKYWIDYSKNGSQNSYRVRLYLFGGASKPEWSDLSPNSSKFDETTQRWKK